MDLRGGRITALEATDACLARIAALNHRLQAFQVVDADRARQAARAVDELLAAGTDLGPLMGVPIAVKAIIAVAGLTTSNGSKLPSEDRQSVGSGQSGSDRVDAGGSPNNKNKK